MDRETVITHLQIIHTWAKFARERDLQFFTAKHLEDIAQWSDDALNLLKENEPQQAELRHTTWFCPRCKNPVEFFSFGEFNSYCAYCGQRLTFFGGA